MYNIKKHSNLNLNLIGYIKLNLDILYEYIY